MSDDDIHSAKLDGSLLGEDREIYWREKLEFLIEFRNEIYFLLSYAEYLNFSYKI